MSHIIAETVFFFEAEGKVLLEYLKRFVFSDMRITQIEGDLLSFLLMKGTRW